MENKMQPFSIKAPLSKKSAIAMFQRYKKEGFNEIDIHYLGMKTHGLKDSKIASGRPVIHSVQEGKFYTYTPVLSTENSPYCVSDNRVFFDGEPLPFKHRLALRIDSENEYYYFRSIKYHTPVLEDETILNLNFKTLCKGCKFCEKEREKKRLVSISPRQCIDLVIKENSLCSLEGIQKISIVTGLFGTEELALQAVLQSIRYACEMGFRGRVFYIGSELQSPNAIEAILSTMSSLGLGFFRYAFTVEKFAERERLMRGPKGRLSLAGIKEKLDVIRAAGVEHLEYAYMPGLDGLGDFEAGASVLAEVAKPHISIFRPVTEKQRELFSPELASMGIEYFVRMRQFFEKIHGGPIFGNNLANLWHFPAERLNPKLTKWEE